MKVSDLQYSTCSLYIDALLDRVRELRTAASTSVPGDHELHRLFTDLDAFDAKQDEALAFYLAAVQGLAIGLGFRSSLDLFVVQRAGFLRPAPPPDLDRLEAAALVAIALLVERGAPKDRAAGLELREALKALRLPLPPDPDQAELPFRL